MKVKGSYFLGTVAAIFLLTLSVKAQDELPILETQDPIHRELNLGEDKTLIYDHPSQLTTVKDSSQVIMKVVPSHPGKSSKPETHKNSPKEKEEENALSFNFLFYMIQKFKMSDLIDQY